MNRRIDIHSHLLPGVDDGCKNLEESLECARMLADSGYSHVFCTPHVWPHFREQSRANLPIWTQALQSAVDTAGIPLRLLTGSELNLSATVREVSPDRIIPMALADRYILVDMWADRLPDWFDATIRWLQDMQLTVILAHPERMRAVQDVPELADRFADMGILLQGNLQCFADRPDADTRITAEQYLLEGRYFALGSDTHNPKTLGHRLSGLQNAIKLAGNGVIDRLTKENPRKLFPEGAI